MREGWNKNLPLENNQPNKKTHPNLVFTNEIAATLHGCDLSIQKAF